MPNSVITFGYTNASRTLEADLTAAWVCRLLRHMERGRHAIAVARPDAGVEPRPFLDFTSGYVRRGRDPAAPSFAPALAGPPALPARHADHSLRAHRRRRAAFRAGRRAH